MPFLLMDDELWHTARSISRSPTKRQADVDVSTRICSCSVLLNHSYFETIAQTSWKMKGGAARRFKRP